MNKTVTSVILSSIILIGLILLSSNSETYAGDGMTSVILENHDGSVVIELKEKEITIKKCKISSPLPTGELNYSFETAYILPVIKFTEGKPGKLLKRRGRSDIIEAASTSEGEGVFAKIRLWYEDKQSSYTNGVAEIETQYEDTSLRYVVQIKKKNK